MKKPAELRQYLLNSVQDLQINPDKLQVFIDKGQLNANLPTNLHFQYEFLINILVTDFSGTPDEVFVPVLAWLRRHQIDAPANAVKFEAEILNNNSVDLSITLPLDERVLVTQDNDGNFTTEHLGEPEVEYLLPEPPLFKTLHQGDEQLTPEQPNE